MDNCARVRATTPSEACGQTNLPLSRRLQNKHRPSPSNQISFTRSPLRPRKMNTWPDSGLFSNLVCTSALSPVKPRRRSVTPAAIQICVLAGGPIIAPDTPTPLATSLPQLYLQSVLSPSPVQSGWSLPPSEESRLYHPNLQPPSLSSPHSRKPSPATAPPVVAPSLPAILGDTVGANETPGSH